MEPAGDKECMNDIRAIFFDFDDTLGDRESYAYDCYRAILEENTQIGDPVEFEAIVQDCMIWDEKGNCNKRHVAEMLRKNYGIELPYENFHAYWDTRLWQFAHPYTETREVLEELKKRYIIGIITNGPSDGNHFRGDSSGIYSNVYW